MSNLFQIITEEIENYEIDQHLRARGVDPKRISVITDKQSGTATFLLYNFSGQLVGYQQYNPNGTKVRGGGKKIDPATMRYFTIIGKEGDGHKLAVWGIDTLDERPFVFVTEGIFDIAKIHQLGLPGVAALTNSPKPLKSWFKLLNKKIIVIADNDDAGQKLKNIADIAFSTPNPFKDLGEMGVEQVKEWLLTLDLGIEL